MTNDNRDQFEKTNTRLQRFRDQRASEGCLVWAIFIVTTTAVGALVYLLG